MVQPCGCDTFKVNMLSPNCYYYPSSEDTEISSIFLKFQELSGLLVIGYVSMVQDSEYHCPYFIIINLLFVDITSICCFAL